MNDPPGGLTGRDLAAAAVVVLVWGFNFVAMKFALRDFTPFQLGAVRFFFAVAPLALWVRAPTIAPGWLVAYALIQGTGQFALLFFALKVGMTAALASVLMQTQVFFTAVFGALALREPVARPLKLGMALAGAGLLCFAVSFWTQPAARAVTAAGFALNLLAAAMWAASNILARRLQATGAGYDPLALVVWSGAVTSASFVVMSLLFDGADARWRWTRASPSAWLAVAYLGWVATALANRLWIGLFRHHPASRVAPFSLGMPVVGLFAGVLVLGEHVTGWQWAGAGLVISALAFVVGGSAVTAARPRPAAACRPSR